MFTYFIEEFFYMRIVMNHALGNMHDVFYSFRPLGIS